MRRTAALIAVMLVATVAGAEPLAAGEHPWNDKRIYYLVEQQGRLREKGFFVRRLGSYEKRPCVVTEEEKFIYPDFESARPTRAIRIRTITTPKGEALQRHEESYLGDPGNEVITIEAGEARIETLGAPASIPVPEGVLFEVTGEWLAQHSLREGASFSAEIIDRRGRGVVTESVDILERISGGSGGQPAVWLAEFNSPGRPPMLARFTSDGRLTRLESQGLVYQVVGRIDFEAGRMPTASIPAAVQPDAASGVAPFQPVYTERGVPVIPIGASVPAWDNFAWLILAAAPPNDWMAAVTPTEYSQVDFNGVQTTLTALRNAPRVNANAVFPMAVPPEIQLFLSPYDDLPVINRAVIEAAYKAVTDTETNLEERNVLKAVSYLAGWINQDIGLQDWTGEPTPVLDALSGKSADVIGQARLFAALGRALGIPTRICQGFLVQTGQAAYHVWAEAWIAGIWIPVDVTVSRVGLPAGYVLAERSGPDCRFARDFAGFMRSPDLTLTLVSGGRETPGRQLAELVVGDRRTYAFSENDWLANLYWGFALRLPPAWSGSAKLDSVELISPDGAASVKCEAMAGTYNAGKDDLNKTISSLRSGLRRFKVVDSRVVSFDAEGATPALFIDFTCTEDGNNLRCRQYILPRRQRAFRISFWAPADRFVEYATVFDSILASFEF